MLGLTSQRLHVHAAAACASRRVMAGFREDDLATARAVDTTAVAYTACMCASRLLSAPGTSAHARSAVGGAAPLRACVQPRSRAPTRERASWLLCAIRFLLLNSLLGDRRTWFLYLFGFLF